MGLELPVLYLLPTHLSSDELHDLEEKIPSLTWDASEASFIVGKISQKKRAQFELRKLKLCAEEAAPPQDEVPATPRAKRRKISHTEDYGFRSDSNTDSDDGLDVSDGETASKASARSDASTRKVVRLAWLQDSLAKGAVLDYCDYLIFEALKTPSATEEDPRIEAPKSPDLLRRAREMASSSQSSSHSQVPYRQRREGDYHKAPRLLPHSTIEENIIANIPPVPAYLHTSYSCQRSTFVYPPNEAFIEKLKEVRELRAMTGDRIGVRAYSSAIASLSAYPYKLQGPIELTRLPGCGEKFSLLFAESEEYGQLSEIQKAESDEKLAAIKTFYNIFGVSAVTAEEFYRRGWRDLDDVVDYGWKTISRSQQIGVKYYDEFLQKIPRPETESIANTILEHARKLRPGFQMTIVGGYRRGKIMSGDVDLMLSHYDEKATHGFIDRLVISLEEDKYITHTLSLSTHNSERGQRPTSYKTSSSGGTGFDTLDKALVVWQDPNFKPTDSSDKNPNIHRRVDILISPWRTVGCAVLGWSSETTFQRDLRRYCKHEKNLKFDSSGIRSRELPYNWVDLEGGERGKAETMEEAEKRVFAGLGLEWKPPEERCTG
ncbi:DNA polymerase type-X family protein pol4 [Cytospora mali]|uniref:DNA polymerase n=1 Tax=Cytospora mali TaxID=578113 RepID=A0A194W3X9_CYTMA|nr:DNA polymerase type-X family protein pol4 [Valsa mali]